MLDYPRSAIAGLSLVFKFGLDPTYSFGDIAIFSQRELTFTFASYVRLSVCRLSVCNVRAPYSGD